MKGQQKTRAKIKSILNSMSDEYKLKTVEDLEKAEQSIFDITWLIDNKFFVQLKLTYQGVAARQFCCCDSICLENGKTTSIFLGRGVCLAVHLFPLLPLRFYTH